MAQLPHKTLFHETAHVILGHTSEADFTDTERTPKNLREVEAEAVALLCCEALNLEGADYCRGYIQNWLCPAIGYNGDAIPEKSAQKIFRAADQILRAGRALAKTVRGPDNAPLTNLRFSGATLQRELPCNQQRPDQLNDHGLCKRTIRLAVLR